MLPTSSFTLRFTGGMSGQSVKTALPGGGGYDANRDPKPLVDIANASIVVNITELVGLSNATFSCGNYGGSEQFSSSSQPPPPVGTLLVVEGQRLAFAVSREAFCCGNDEELITIQAELIGDFCKRAPEEKVCKGHNEKAATPPSSSPNTSSSAESGSGSTSQEGESITSAPPTPAATTKSASARRLVLSAAVACLAVAATVL